MSLNLNNQLNIGCNTQKMLYMNLNATIHTHTHCNRYTKAKEKESKHYTKESLETTRKTVRMKI